MAADASLASYRRRSVVRVCLLLTAAVIVAGAGLQPVRELRRAM
jgi:hypothetical protein